jgi:hypothetical protein
VKLKAGNLISKKLKKTRPIDDRGRVQRVRAVVTNKSEQEGAGTFASEMSREWASIWGGGLTLRGSIPRSKLRAGFVIRAAAHDRPFGTTRNACVTTGTGGVLCNTTGGFPDSRLYRETLNPDTGG